MAQPNSSIPAQSKQSPDSLVVKTPVLEILFLSLISAMPPLSTDMYLGAMPTIAAQWEVSTGMVSLSLILWFVSFSAALLIFGPLSDKYGRKPILVGGLVLFMLASIGCSASADVYQLIFFRIIQGIGAAGPSSMVMAIARDRYQGNVRKNVLAYMGIIMALAPMIAPSIGALILMFASWRVIFLAQTCYALMCLFFVTRFGETNLHLSAGHLLKMLGRYHVVMANRRFFLANATMGLLVGPLFAFIALSSPIYIKIFGLSEQVFGLFFGFNAMMLMLGAFACTRLTKWFADTTILTGCMVGCILGGLGVLLLGSFSPVAFALTVGTISFSCGISRPLSNHLILDQVETDVGSASSFSVFYVFIVGAASMAMVSIPWHHPIIVLGWFAVIVPAVVLCVWPLLLNMLKVAAAHQVSAIRIQNEASTVTVETEI